MAIRIEFAESDASPASGERRMPRLREPFGGVMRE
jgi:hypothetical protein